MSKKEEIIIDGADVSGCSINGVECNNFKCADNPDCYYKQWQREKQKNEILLKEIEIQNDIEDKYWQILEDIAEIAKTKIYTPVCFEDLDCPKNGGTGFDNDCEEYCPLIMLEKILEKIKEGEKTVIER